MKNLKKLAAAAAAVTMCASLFAFGSKKSKKNDAKQKVYLIATDTTFAPFEFQDIDGKFTGIDMDILEAVSEDQHFSYKLQVIGFNAAVQSLESKQSDGVIAGMSITDERKKKFDFSDPYFDSGVVMGIGKNSTITSYSDLKGKKVAIKTGTEGASFAESIKDKYGFTVAYFEDSANMYEDVRTGNSVACFEDYPVLGYAISKNVGLKIVTQKEHGNSYGFAVNKGLNAELLAKFNKGLADIKANGKYQAILDKYIKK
jgi:ABC-type amino acid transport substrate-binding protein